VKEKGMLPVLANYYIHVESIGDFPLCEKVFYESIEKLKALYEDGKIEGFNLIVPNDEEDVREKLIWCNYTDITSDVFPFVCAVIQFFDVSAPDIDAELSEWGFSSCSRI
jgi:hypothetical protein